MNDGQTNSETSAIQHTLGHSKYQCIRVLVNILFGFVPPVCKYFIYFISGGCIYSIISYELNSFWIVCICEDVVLVFVFPLG